MSRQKGGEEYRDWGVYPLHIALLSKDFSRLSTQRLHFTLLDNLTLV